MARIWLSASMVDPHYFSAPTVEIRRHLLLICLRRKVAIMRILVINGPNLNWLGRRDPAVYGSMSLKDIETNVAERARELSVDVDFFQSNSEGAIIDHLQSQASSANGIIINPGALTHYGLSLREALVDTALPIVEVHLSNIYARERWRHRSLVAPVARGQISGLGWQGYIAALEYLAATISEGDHP